MFRLQGVKYKEILRINELKLPEQRTTCIIGESGSGKTTLLRLLNHLISCDEGDIWYRNTPLSQWDPVSLRRNVVMLSQTPAIFQGTVRENLLIGRRFSEKPPVEDQRLQEALETVRLHKELSQNADALSGGEKQRLALARVLLMEPEVFLLDEPSSALDEETTQFVMGQLVKHARQDHKTVIMVTHSKAVVQAYAEHVVEVHQGQLVLEKEN